MIKEVILKGGFTLECKVYDFLNEGLVSQTVAILHALLVRLMVKLRSGHIMPGLRSRAKDNKTKARLHRKEPGD